jgi:hypothetical protein
MKEGWGKGRAEMHVYDGKARRKRRTEQKVEKGVRVISRKPGGSLSGDARERSC